MLPVSICLTTYNRGAVLPKTLDSILSQSFEDFELIISDDCSTDNTEEICRDYQSKDQRVRYFRNSQNLKMPGNLNAAIQRATGVYIANVHDGDVYRPNLIEKWKQALDEVPEAPFVFNAYDAVLADGSHHLCKEPFDRWIPGEYIALHYFRTMGCCVWGTVMARSSAYAKAGPFDPSFGFISDVDMWLRLARNSVVAYVPEPIIEIAPREPDHPFAYHSWLHLFWQFGIYTKHLEYYSHRLPKEVAQYAASYSRMLQRRFLRAMLSLVKHRKWDRVREGLAIWRDANDPLLRSTGWLFGHRSWQPNWYDATYWSKVQLPGLEMKMAPENGTL